MTTPAQPQPAIERLIATWRSDDGGPTDGAIARDRCADELEALLPALAKERERLERGAATEKCDKCGTMVPRNMIAIELKDGAPIDDPAGFQWCIVCHDRRVLTELRDRLATETQARQEADSVVTLAMGEWAKERERRDAALTAEREARQIAETAAAEWRDRIAREIEARLQADRERDVDKERVASFRAEADIAGHEIVRLRAQLTASERARAQAETEQSSERQRLHMSWLQSDNARRQAETELAQYRGAFTVCDAHTPEQWESDGSCVICEGGILKDSLVASESARDELAKTLASSAVRCYESETDREALRTALEVAGEAIHSEFCTSKHHVKCANVTAALSAAQAREPRPATDPDWPDRVG